MTDNPNCDSAHCISDTGEVRLYPLGGEPLHGNLILCRACWTRENSYRISYNSSASAPNGWPVHDWDDAKPYPEQEQTPRAAIDKATN